MKRKTFSFGEYRVLLGTLPVSWNVPAATLPSEDRCRVFGQFVLSKDLRKSRVFNYEHCEHEGEVPRASARGGDDASPGNRNAN